MILLADESVDRPIVERLREDGHVVPYVAEMSPSITDDQVLQEANSRNAPLLTADKDFGEVGLPTRPSPLRSSACPARSLPTASKAEIVAKAIQDHTAELAGAFSVISPGAVRIRK